MLIFVLLDAVIAPISVAVLVEPTTTIATTTQICFTEPSPRPSNSWFFVGNMSSPRYSHTASLLSQDNSVFIAGGNGTGVLSSLQYADLFDPWTGHVTTITMTTPRRIHTTALTLNASYLVLIGGLGINTLNSTDIFNIHNLSFSTNLSNTMTTPRHLHTTTRLGNTSDYFLITGRLTVWVPLSSAELYNGSSNTFTSLGATYIPSMHQVLITGGTTNWATALNTMTVFDIVTMSDKRMSHTATLLLNGKVLLVGGSNGNTSLPTCELIDPTNSNYSSTSVASLHIGRYYHTTTLISSSGGDTALVCGGYNTDLGSLNSCELYFV